MSYIGRIPFPPESREGDAYRAFCIARQRAACAFLTWLRERPASDDVGLELAGTIEVFRQLATLAKVGA
jgi:hypothetical protein